QQSHAEAHKAIGKQLSGLMVDEDMVGEVMKKLNLPATITAWTEEQLMQLASELRKRTKPMIVACNKIDIPGAKENFERLKKDFPDRIFIPCSAESELALREASRHNLISYTPGENSFEAKGALSERQMQGLTLISEKILIPFGSTGVQQALNTAVFDLLKYKALFPGGVGKLEDSDGNVLPDCFLMEADTTSLDFAFRLHTDFGKNFIKAINVRTKLPMGKDHVLNHLDIIEIMAK
ncbi:MAG: TGS domain-containing protein, partial [Candidatus Woesearchaeota archaeon]